MQANNLEISPIAQYLSFSFAKELSEKQAQNNQIETENLSSHEKFQRIFSLLNNELEQGNSILQRDALDFSFERDDFLPHLIQQQDNNNEQVINKPSIIIANNDNFQFYRIFQAEKRLAKNILKLIDKKRNISASEIELLRQKFARNLNKEQEKAFCRALQENFSIITGGPGTGKTYTLATITAAICYLAEKNKEKINIMLAAPTGKAAKRMEESLRSAFSNFEQPPQIEAAQTIHRLLGLGRRNQAKFNDKNHLPYRVIIIDEASMLSLEIADLLFNAIAENCQIILLGDANQLASVEPGAVLYDISRAEVLQNNITELQESRRFDENSEIAQIVRATLDGNTVKTKEILENSKKIELIDIKTSDIYSKLTVDYQKFFSLDLKNTAVDEIFNIFDDFRILCSSKISQLGSDFINQKIQEIVRKKLGLKEEYYAGLPLMINQNDYQKEIFNGEIGILLKNHTGGDLNLYFPNGKIIPFAAISREIISPAYAMTIHKSQGSEYRKCAIVLNENQEKLLSRELFYTAISRAKEEITIYANQKIIAKTIMNKNQRTTGLKKWLE
ncbi:MAG: exodeoxyribonuclease V subunit alpha [Cardiobacteriaceae bacterium]|nr:exodeoxyribonuclease V subunit alpha [Cardiobacteriaceae bacterium]